MPKANLSEIKSRDRQVVLVMAEGFAKEGYIQHGIAAYEAVIEAAPESKEAEQAEDALVRIAETYNQDYLHDRILERRTKKVTSPFKYPRAIEYVDKLPKTISGKIKRKELKKKEWEKAR